MTSSEWSDMQADLADVLSKSGGGGNFSEQTPEYFACDFFFNDKQWYDVGVRYKGNSTLESASNSNIGKLPLRFVFDKFEDDHPEIFNSTKLPSPKGEGFGFRLKPTKVCGYTVVKSSSPLSLLS